MATENELKQLKRRSMQAFIKYQKATQEYHWTQADDDTKLKRLVELQKADAEAFRRYVEALKASKSGK